MHLIFSISALNQTVTTGESMMVLSRRFWRLLLCTTAGLIPLPTSSQAFAQTASSASAESESAAIVVTARRMEERLQDVPISVGVLSSDKLLQANIASADSLAKYIPGLTATQRYSPEMSTFSIRGFTQELRTSASVGTYFADVVAPRGGGASLSGGDGAGPAYLFDLQNVQVLKGPQGTLFGRNTTGGAVLFAPRKPTRNFEGYIEGTYGNFGMLRIQSIVNVPVSSDVRLRLGVDKMQRDGYLHNVSGIGPRTYADVDYTAARASLDIDLTPDIENYTVGIYSFSDHQPAAFQVFNANPALGLGRLAAAQVARLQAGNDPYQVEINLPNPRSRTRFWQVINQTTFRVSRGVTIKNNMSYSQIRQGLRAAIFGSNFSAGPGTIIYTSVSFNPQGGYTNSQNNLVDELQLQGVAIGGKLNWQAGLYYEISTPDALVGSVGPSNGAVCLSLGVETADDYRCRSSAAAPTSVNMAKGSVKYINMAAYSQGTYALTDTLKLTAGIRYTYDRSRGVSVAQLRLFPTNGAFNAAGPAICEAGFAVPGCRVESSTSSTKPTWTLNAAYKPIERLMVYGTWSRGYRQGAANPFAAPLAQTFEPESVDAYELGTKTEFAGTVSGIFNIAGYYNRLSKQQLQFALQPLPGTLGSNRTSIFNAGKSRIYGAEMNASLLFGRIFRLDGAANYLKTKLISRQAVSLPGYVVIPTADVGGELPYSPKWSANIGGTVTLPLPASTGKVDMGASYRYQASYQIQAASVTPLRSTPVRQLDLNLDWHNVMNKPIDLAVFATNVTGQVNVITVNGLFGSFGFDGRQLGEPRMYGMRVRLRFGPNMSK
jgi:iron complex outermembrane receptor protein